MTEFLGVIITIYGLIANIGLFMQTAKIIKNKSAENVSIYMYMIGLSSAIIWQYYAWTINEWPIIIFNSVYMIGAISVVVVFSIFSKRPVKKVEQK